MQASQVVENELLSVEKLFPVKLGIMLSGKKDAPVCQPCDVPYDNHELV